MAKLQVTPIVRCEPEDDRCVRTPWPNFLPGISVRHSISCTDHVCGLFQCDGGNWRVTNQGTLDRTRWLEGWIITQLLTRGEVDCAEHPLRKRGGGWWADSYRQTEMGTRGFRSGSKLWALKWPHRGATNELLLTAKTYALQALSQLQSWGVVARIDVDALYIARGTIPQPGAVIHLKVKVSGPINTSLILEGSQQTNFEWLWREYAKPAVGGHIPGRLYERVAV